MSGIHLWYTMLLFGIHETQYLCPNHVSDFMYCTTHPIKLSPSNYWRNGDIGWLVKVTSLNLRPLPRHATLQAWVSTKWSPINSFFLNNFNISISNIHFYHLHENLVMNQITSPFAREPCYESDHGAVCTRTHCYESDHGAVFTRTLHRNTRES